jgi:hypothetical protein
MTMTRSLAATCAAAWFTLFSADALAGRIIPFSFSSNVA